MERPEHPAHVDAARRCAARRPARFEKGLAPEQAMEAQAVATRLMVELCRRAARAGDDRRRRPPAARADADPAARRARERAARRADRRASAAPRSSARWASASPTPSDGLDVTRPALPPQRRHARGRPDRGGRADRRRRQAARDAARRRPRRDRPADAGAAAAAPRVEDALAGAGLLRGRRLEFTEPGLADRLRLPAGRPAPALSPSRTRCPPSRRCCARRCSARCSTSRAHNVAHGHAGRARSSRRAPCTRRRRGRRSRCRTSRTTSARC